ncbi:hypothetical protein, partial [Pedosphaera parvula]|uniref:hypothetical protein n=1 Tax=Pedosphaera parvula TaxID=1032527 RepID=UPI001ED8DF03
MTGPLGDWKAIVFKLAIVFDAGGFGDPKILFSITNSVVCDDFAQDDVVIGRPNQVFIGMRSGHVT